PGSVRVEAVDPGERANWTTNLPEIDSERCVRGEPRPVHVERAVDEDETCADRLPACVGERAVSRDAHACRRQAAGHGPADVVDTADTAVEELVLPDHVHVRLARPHRPDVCSVRYAPLDPASRHRAGSLEPP